MDFLDGFNCQLLEFVYNFEDELILILEEEQWLVCFGGLMEIGYQSEGFYFDNEMLWYWVWLELFELSNILVSNVGYVGFIVDGGY